MRAEVVGLPLAEPARFNPVRLESLCSEIGELRAETEVAEALDRIARNLRQLGLGAGSGWDDPALAGLVSRLAGDAEHIGMTTLARVARDVLTCAGRGDVTGFGATKARLQRVGERSIHAVWDLDDLSG